MATPNRQAAWSTTTGGGSVPGLGAGEVFGPAELAAGWKLSEQTIRRLFQDRPGVFKLANDGNGKKRGYCTLRIPRAVAEAVWRERAR